MTKISYYPSGTFLGTSTLGNTLLSYYTETGYYIFFRYNKNFIIKLPVRLLKAKEYVDRYKNVYNVRFIIL